MSTEILNKRKYHSKVRQNEDGTMTLSSHIGHIHYKNGGEFVDSDISFEDKGTYWEMSKHNYHLQVVKDFSAPLLMRYTNVWEGANHTITYEPKMLAWVNATDLSDMQIFRNQQAVQGIINGDVIRYTDAFGDGIHFEITLRRSGFSKEIVIDALNKLENPPSANHKLVALFQYGGNGLKILKGQEEWDKESYLEGSNGFEIAEDGNGLAKSFITPAYIVDSFGLVGKRQSIKVFWKKHNNKLWQAKILPKQFLLNATYPVRADTVTQYYTGAGDGYTYKDNLNSTWTLTVQGTGEGADYTIGNGYGFAISDHQSNFRNYHGYFPADTSGLTSGATITAATLNIYQTASLNTNPCTFSIVETTQASTSQIVTADYLQWVSADIGSNTIATGGANNAYKVWNFSDLTKISKTGFTKVGIIGTEAITLTDPGSVGNQGALQLNASEAASNDPYYEITYTVAAGPSNLKSLDTNLKANIKSYNTNVLANIKSINTNV